VKAPNIGPPDLHKPEGFTQKTPKVFWVKGLDESREMRILTDGLGVDQAFRGITVGSKKVLPA